jgi:hypothetical protein
MATLCLVYPRPDGAMLSSNAAVWLEDYPAMSFDGGAPELVDGELHVVPVLQLPDVGVHLTPERLFG